MKKRVLASVLACAMAVSTATVAFAADYPGNAFGAPIDANVTTDSQAAKIEFSVPVNFTVGLDPFQAGDKSGSQVYSNSQPIYNKSNIPIRVIVKAGLDIKQGDDGSDLVTLKNAAGDVTSADITNTNKEAYVELVAEPATATTDRSGAVTVTATNLEGKNFATEYKATGADTTAKTAVKAAAADGSLTSQVSFALQAATYATDRSGAETFSAFAADNKGIASFRFMGSLNANAANWSKDDMEVKVVYDVNGMGTAAYDALIGASAPASVDAKMKAANVYSVADAAGGSSTPGSTDPSAADQTYSLTTKGTLDVVIANATGYDTVDSIKVTGGKLTSEQTLATPADYSVDTTSGMKLTFTEGNASSAGLLSLNDASSISSGKTDVTIKVTLSDSTGAITTTKEVTFKITYSA